MVDISALGAPVRAMPKSLVVIFVLLVVVDLSATARSVIKEVSGEDAAIDNLEQFLQARNQHSDHARQVDAHSATNQRIEFGVGPNDPRYFADGGSNGKFLPGVHNRAEGLQMRSGPGDMRYFSNSVGNGARHQAIVEGPDNPTRGESSNGPLYKGPHNNVPYDLYGGGETAALKPTSQPESVNIPHQKPQHQASRSNNNSTSESNPNDPSPVNVDVPGPVLPNTGQQPVEGLPAHYQTNHQSAGVGQAAYASSNPPNSNFNDVYFIALVAGCTAAAVCAVIGTGVCWYRMNKNQRAAKDAEYPAYGVTGPSRELSPGLSGGSGGGDRTLAHSAHMYHYQQQKNQMIAIDKSGVGEGGGSDIDTEEEEEGEDGDRDYTVYECPGLAPMGEMMVPNPMYPPDDNSPTSPSFKEEEERDDDE